jgi:hypothetical protein
MLQDLRAVSVPEVGLQPGTTGKKFQKHILFEILSGIVPDS